MEKDTRRRKNHNKIYNLRRLNNFTKGDVISPVQPLLCCGQTWACRDFKNNLLIVACTAMGI